MKGAICILAVLILAGAANASEIEVEFNVLTTNSTIYVWTGSSTPIECGSGSTASCDIDIEYEDNCNQSLLQPILNNLTAITAKINDLNNSVGSTLSTSVTSSLGDTLKTSQATVLFDQLKNDLTLKIDTSEADNIKYTQTDVLLTDCKVNLTKSEGQANLYASQLADKQKELTDTQNAKNDLTNVMIVLIIALGFMVLRLQDMVPGVSKRKPSIA